MAKYIFYRILGNDIPLRHRKGQTFSNLKIILDREPIFKDVEDRWIINRIVDPKEEHKIIKLLEKYTQKYQVIRFDTKKFKKIPTECFNERHDALIGLNEARNLALREGKRIGRWILVFDGSCFFTSSAWQKIVQACSKRGNFKYIIVPMIRIVFGENGIPCEPQIIFRNDSKDEFDENFRYGQNSKVDLLFRLGVPGMWDQWNVRLKDLSMKRPANDLGAFITAGHVWRLPSGNERADSHIIRREELRKRGIVLLMNKIDKMSN
jgi:hypothetical protein